MTSPKTVTPDQPQAVPDAAITERDRITGIIMRHLDATSNDGEQGEVWIVRRILEEIATETDETGYWQDKAEGLQADLENAVETAFNRGAVEWTRLNYPAQFAVLAARPVLPVETPAEGLREAVEDAIRRNMGMIGGRVPVQFGSGLVRDICAVLASTTPAPLSGKDGSLREALEKIAKAETVEFDSDLQREVVVSMSECEMIEIATAALAAVPPETAEMEGEPVAWLYRPLQAGNIPVARCKRLSDVGDSWQEIPLYTRTADRLAARASSSGEAGDE